MVSDTEQIREEYTPTHNGRGPKTFRDASSDVKPKSKTDRKRYAWRSQRGNDGKLSEQQHKVLDGLYTPREQNLVPNPFSLAATLARYPDLAYSFDPDWANIEDSQLSFSFSDTGIRNTAVLWLEATNTKRDPFEQ